MTQGRRRENRDPIRQRTYLRKNGVEKGDNTKKKLSHPPFSSDDWCKLPAAESPGILEVAEMEWRFQRHGEQRNTSLTPRTPNSDPPGPRRHARSKTITLADDGVCPAQRWLVSM